MHNKQLLLTRRDFLRGTIGATLAASMLGVNWARGSQGSASSSLVTVVRDEKVIDVAGLNVDKHVLKKMLDQSMIQFTGKKSVNDAWSTIVKPGDTVGLVPTDYFNPTHHELIDAVKSSLEDIGVPRKKIKIAQGSLRRAEACNVLISMPALKAHWLTGIGTVFKNYIMFSGHPSRYHEENSAKLGEIWHLPKVSGKTKLVLVDALYPLCHQGPQPDPRYKWAYNGLITGTDPVAVEMVCLRIIEEKRWAMRGEPWPLSPPSLCLETADRVYRLGTNRMQKIKIENFGWDMDLLL